MIPGRGGGGTTDAICQMSLHFAPSTARDKRRRDEDVDAEQRGDFEIIKGAFSAIKQLWNYKSEVEEQKRAEKRIRELDKRRELYRFHDAYCPCSHITLPAIMRCTGWCGCPNPLRKKMNPVDFEWLNAMGFAPTSCENCGGDDPESELHARLYQPKKTIKLL